ncbi:hypothetical protein F4778DRAFT_754806 [Xylariomycetidae sp. FL2044]|nr:hypothetical protein F4778DRAFT_754806 [Xylariomycetidae sp. FL2044]
MMASYCKTETVTEQIRQQHLPVKVIMEQFQSMLELCTNSSYLITLQRPQCSNSIVSRRRRRTPYYITTTKISDTVSGLFTGEKKAELQGGAAVLGIIVITTLFMYRQRPIESVIGRFLTQDQSRVPVRTGRGVFPGILV